MLAPSNPNAHCKRRRGTSFSVNLASVPGWKRVLRRSDPQPFQLPFIESRSTESPAQRPRLAAFLAGLAIVCAKAGIHTQDAAKISVANLLEENDNFMSL